MHDEIDYTEAVEFASNFADEVLTLAMEGKPVPPKKEAYVHLAGMVLLLIIVVAVFFNDIHNIFN